MVRLSWTKTVVLTFLTLFLGKISSVLNLDEAFFNSNLSFGISLSNLFTDNHVKVSELKINSAYLFDTSPRIDLDLALSALKGIEAIGDRGKSDGREWEVTSATGHERNPWTRISREDFFKKQEHTEDLMKGMPMPYHINNIADAVREINFYFNQGSKIHEEDLIYRGRYTPEIYTDVYIIITISFMYLFCIKVICEGYMRGKNVAKKYIAKVSTLFFFFLIFKNVLNFLPTMLSSTVCLIMTFYFYSISMNPCDKIQFLKKSSIKKEPIGWVLIVFAESIIIGNILYHAVCTPQVLITLSTYVPSEVFLRMICLLFLLLIGYMIFLLMISNLVSAKKAQNFVFSFTSSYLIVSCCTYFFNIYTLRVWKNTNIFQIEPMMFFSYSPKFVFNAQNAIALAFTFVITALSMSMPKLLKNTRGFFAQGGKRKKGGSSSGERSAYDIIMNCFA
ncbi:conserved Plasmodium protein, unknown function [Plasmodium knowlesi strain H]|uniref:Serpentine receptor n=3 Tax=Plasmodium knowlesi TaxID=5850 RepID=A0A5K1VDC1_PLAKH|nr:conserved protein, unknown function [Plasmodium knowlesi strain H]OTN67464.1 Uncharacterized protein PKNOH_S06411700 [Plasmodium knowlesi]CAA9987392.1 conserved protein, unknown function [Plasmodium knowlesi strain H]SBO23310.1 conserved Plasmodium protein, unknown function [Plasmodium knowlesi strain H]SBO24362.1 conserved Plasmodium protein, unknown function [Plasmodium knowlesi strain H]VVS76866.1 conserved protein, unknown function [Plasmodium knowlesi strain H]|eukprot:XP_002258395.1 hypothetical protein, conserved in Plasmodium species [Plasmodium knowlesi strain H]